MRMPGFTAEASQFKTNRHYRRAAAFARSSLASSVVPAKCFNEGWCGDCKKHGDGWLQQCCLQRIMQWVECDPPPGTPPETPPPTKPSCRKICCVDGQPQLI
jgi:hypothetical protein